MESPALKVVAFTRDPADAEVVDYLEGLLARAKSGELRAVSVIGECRRSDGEVITHNASIGQFFSLFTLAGQHQFEIHKIMATLVDDEQVPPE